MKKELIFVAAVIVAEIAIGIYLMGKIQTLSFPWMVLFAITVIAAFAAGGISEQVKNWSKEDKVLSVIFYSTLIIFGTIIFSTATICFRAFILIALAVMFIFGFLLSKEDTKMAEKERKLFNKT